MKARVKNAENREKSNENTRKTVRSSLRGYETQHKTNDFDGNTRDTHKHNGDS